MESRKESLTKGFATVMKINNKKTAKTKIFKEDNVSKKNLIVKRKMKRKIKKYSRIRKFKRKILNHY